ncbi:DNA alkylation repair protein [Desulfotomaculum sp. 1211_IL3151]|uniref:DNA alkylation repair protein n=1 Tax=Desulfotomaculum sp. 1211_IL3151 TaxID=3084055 RepID=UPI002FDA0AF7
MDWESTGDYKIMYNELINSFLENSDQEQAVKMAAYMKNNFPFLGIPKPKRASLGNGLMKKAKKQKGIDWNFVLMLWERPEREFQYLAIDYLLVLKDYLQKKDIDNVRFLIITKPWWDTVDSIAGNITGVLCLEHPELISSPILKWAESDHIWLVRSAILYQLKYKEKTDAALLGLIIKQNSETKEFFINKAIGWALREYSKTNKEWVKEFIQTNTLSPLSVREGSKYLAV